MCSNMNVINDLIENPRKYFERPSLQALYAYLGGYAHTHPNCDCNYLQDFNTYVADHYGLQSDHNWASMIEFFSADDMDAFENFSRLFDEFAKEQTNNETAYPLCGQAEQTPLLDIILEVCCFPELFLGEASVARLSAFLQGCGHGDPLYDASCLDHFRDFLMKKYHITICRSWDKILEFIACDDRVYDLFIENFNEYLMEKGHKTSLIVRRKKKAQNKG